MTTLLDIVFATVLGGIIMLITLNANMNLRETWTSYNNQAMIQQMLVQTAEILECDLRNMGCGVAASNQSITFADSNKITFLMAERPEITSIPIATTYSVSDLYTPTDNPYDRWLQRTRSGITDNIGLVTQFKLKYIDRWGELMTTPVPAADLQNIKTIEITMEVQSPYVALFDPNKRFASALWKQTRLASQNLLR